MTSNTCGRQHRKDQPIQSLRTSFCHTMSKDASPSSYKENLLWPVSQRCWNKTWRLHMITRLKPFTTTSTTATSSLLTRQTWSGSLWSVASMRAKHSSFRSFAGWIWTQMPDFPSVNSLTEFSRLKTIPKDLCRSWNELKRKQVASKRQARQWREDQWRRMGALIAAQPWSNLQPMATLWPQTRTSSREVTPIVTASTRTSTRPSTQLADHSTIWIWIKPVEVCNSNDRESRSNLPLKVRCRTTSTIYHCSKTVEPTKTRTISILDPRVPSRKIEANRLFDKNSPKFLRALQGVIAIWTKRCPRNNLINKMERGQESRLLHTHTLQTIKNLQLLPKIAHDLSTSLQCPKLPTLKPVWPGSTQIASENCLLSRILSRSAKWH